MIARPPLNDHSDDHDNANTEEKPFHLTLSSTQIQNLRAKLSLTRLPDELDNAGWGYGVPLSSIRRLAYHWEHEYDFAAWEDRVNEFKMFTRDIEVEGHGRVNVHYVHEKSEVESAIPLLFIHGWPGHFMEVAKMIPLLTKPSDSEDPSFHVVAISLPGFGFSEAPKKRGFGVRQHAETAHKLMLALGYSKYVAQGGDWGSGICRKLAQLYAPKHLKSFHTNLPLTSPPSLLRHPLLTFRTLLASYFSPSFRAGLARTQAFNEKGSGYFSIQTTKPQTLAYGIEDSPVGLLAWIYEKLVNWTDGYPWTDDEVLDWISLYWFSKPGPAASIRIYYEAHQAGEILESPTLRCTKIPIGISYFPGEIIFTPKMWSSLAGNVVFIGDHSKTGGGHFAAFERPEELAKDLRTMFGRGGGAFGVVNKRNGYTEARY